MKRVPFMQAKRKRVLLHLALTAMTVSAAIALGAQAPRLYRALQGPVRSGDFAQHVANQPHALTLYGTSTCRHCARARAYLRQAGIAFNDRDIDTSNDAAALYDKLGEHAVPILVSERQLIIGFREKDYATLTSSVNK
jgi:glutaredoxin